MKVGGSVALVTGGNRGLGASFCAALLERGAAKVYAGVRDVSTVTAPGVEAVPLDVTSQADIDAAVARCGDVTLLINSAGISTGSSVFADDARAQLQRQFDTNVFGPFATSRAFAPVLAANGGGAIINVLSVVSWFASPNAPLYSAAKSAVWSLTNSLRLELLGQHTQVVSVHVGMIDTDMTAGIVGPKSSPDEVARRVLDALEAGQSEVLVDDVSRRVKAALSQELHVLYPSIAGR
jgi:NAD(P)-dependent dehydrogenase (short-subunit alcohol dehydrogenase family)